MHSEEDDLLSKEEEEEDAAGPTLELPVLETELGSQELDQALVIRQEEFAEVDGGDYNIKEELKDKKVAENILQLHMYAIETFSFFGTACFCTSAVRLYFCRFCMC